MNTYDSVQKMIGEWVKANPHAALGMVDAVTTRTTRQLRFYNNGHRVSVLPWPVVFPATVNAMLGRYNTSASAVVEAEMRRVDYIPDDRLLAEGMTPLQVTLLRSERHVLSCLSRIPSIGRDDAVFYPETGGMHQIEMNRRFQAGALYQSEANALFQHSPCAEWLTSQGVRYMTYDPAYAQLLYLVETFRRMQQELRLEAGPMRIHVWCPPSRGAETDEEERMLATLLANKEFGELDIELVIADNPVWWHSRDGQLYYGQEMAPVRFVWRRISSHEIPEGRNDWLVNTYWVSGHVVMVNPWVSEWINNKSLQAHWASESYFAELGMSNHNWLASLLPPGTKFFTADDIEQVLQNPTEWLIKLVDGAGGQGTYHGGMLWNTPDGKALFLEGMSRGLRHPSILMGRIEIPWTSLPVPTLNGIEMLEMAYGMEPLVSDQEPFGFLVRAKQVDEFAKQYGTFMNVGAKGTDPIPAGIAPAIILLD